jgi:transketolase
MYKTLEQKSKHFRLKILDTIYNAGKGHIGGAYSCIDILTVLYYGGLLDINKNNFEHENRNRFLLSKGHAAIAQYVILEDLGLFDTEELLKMNNGGILGEHPDHNIPGVEFDSGSLGHGLSIASGMAYAAKLDNKDYKTYVVLGDGECYEGTIWEAAQLSSHLGLDNLIAIVDRNNLCIHGDTEKINKLNPFGAKWKAFGWNVVEVNGHDHSDLLRALTNTRSSKPTVIIANTIKGKGVSFMENNHKWHHGGISDEVYALCQKEIMEAL